MSVILRYLLVAWMTMAITAAAYADGFRNDPIRVMTQNLYIGADVTRIVDAAYDQIPAVVHQTFAQLSASDFASRERTFAEQVKDARPDVIGLQEVSLIRIQKQSDFFMWTETEERHSYSHDDRHGH